MPQLTIKTMNYTYTFTDGKCYRDGHYYGDVVEMQGNWIKVNVKGEIKTFVR